MNGTESKAESRTPIFSRGASGANALDNLAHEPRAIFQAAAVGTGPIDRAEEFMAEIAVTVLDVDEIVAAGLGADFAATI